MGKTDSISSHDSTITTVPEDAKSRVKFIDGLGMEMDQAENCDTLWFHLQKVLNKNKINILKKPMSPLLQNGTVIPFSLCIAMILRLK